LGRFEEGRLTSGFPKSSLPIAMLGTLLLVTGWIGFNGGSGLRMDDSVGPTILNTLLAAAAGGAAAFAASRLTLGVLSPEAVINGVLGGLVASCASADAASASGSIVIGLGAGVTSLLATVALLRLRIDDAVGAFPVHGACGVFGVLAAAFVAGDGGLSDRLLVQGIGAVAIAAMGFVPVLMLVGWVLPEASRRVTPEEEAAGLNLSEHGVESEMQALCRALETAVPTERDSHAAAPEGIDPSDEAGALAAAYQGRIDQAFHAGEVAKVAEAKSQQAEQLRDYGRFLHAVLDGIEAHLCILDGAGRIVETNQPWDRFVAASGVAAEGAVGSSYVAFCRNACIYGGAAASELPGAINAVASGAAAGFAAEYPAVIGAQERTLEVSLKPLPASDRGAVVVLQCDRTETRQAERLILEEKQKAETLASALEASQESLELAVNGGNLGMWHWDVTSGYFELNAPWFEGLGLDVAALNADVDSFRDWLPADERVLWTPEDAASLTEEEPYDRQFRIRRADGAYVWVQALGRVNAVRQDGSPESLSGILIDIDARKNAELRDAGMAQIIEESFNEVYVVDLATLKFLEVNRGARENLGYSLDELRDLSPPDIKLKGSEREFAERVAQLTGGGRRQLEFESVNRRRDGTTYPIMMTIQPARLMDRDVLVGIGVDLTQRRELEQQLAQAQRLESIGQLAAGVAHEMNTPLQFVGNNIKFLNDCSDALFEVLDTYEQNVDLDSAPKPWRERYEAIREVIQRTRFDRVRAEMPNAIQDSLEGISRVLKIVRAMKEFSHPGDQQMAPTDLNQALSSTATITRNRWKSAAELELDLAAELPHVTCEPGAINQVLVNLIVNAADAITDRRAGDPSAPAGQIVVRSRLEGSEAVFEVQDNGCGMPEEVRTRMFDPFYTTKEVGRGTGQGLSLSHTIVTQNHRGAIDAESEPGVGTVVRMRLPIDGPDSATAQSSVPAEPGAVAATDSLPVGAGADG
ncbi:MAG: ATP-binding protein, partial [Planctomycetota bacterium]